MKWSKGRKDSRTWKIKVVVKSERVASKENIKLIRNYGTGNGRKNCKAYGTGAGGGGGGEREREIEREEMLNFAMRKAKQESKIKFSPGDRLPSHLDFFSGDFPRSKETGE